MKNTYFKIYIAGKITGNPNYKEEFALLERELKKQYPTASILNPAVLPQGMSQADYMRICLAMIDTADVVVFNGKAEQSKGASIEKEYCKYTGKTYITITRPAEIIIKCPLCHTTPDVGYECGEYYLIDSDTNCPCCGEFHEMHRLQSDLINGWNVYAIFFNLMKKKGRLLL